MTPLLIIHSVTKHPTHCRRCADPDTLNVEYRLSCHTTRVAPFCRDCTIELLHTLTTPHS